MVRLGFEPWTADGRCRRIHWAMAATDLESWKVHFCGLVSRYVCFTYLGIKQCTHEACNRQSMRCGDYLG